MEKRAKERDLGIIAFQDLKQKKQPTEESGKVWAVGHGEKKNVLSQNQMK